MGIKKFYRLIIVFCLLFSFSTEVTAETLEKSIYLKETILIDAGHGGIDGGAVGPNSLLEKDINLLIAKKTKDLLTKAGYNVIMSREEDMGLYTESGTIRKKKLEDLDNRQKLIKESNCQVFISIHLNAFPQRQYHGAQVWYANNRASMNFAYLMQRNLREDLDNENKRQAKPAKDGYIILRNPPDIPAIIVECGFLSNANEALMLKEDSYQQKIAQCIEKTVTMYLKDKIQ